MKVHKLPSGAELNLRAAPFEEAHELFKAVMAEGKGLRIELKSELNFNFWKDVACMAFSSERVLAAMKKCQERSTYNGSKITADIWEKEEAREDYIPVCAYILTENISPFMKGLYAEFSRLLTIQGPSQK